MKSNALNLALLLVTAATLATAQPPAKVSDFQNLMMTRSMHDAAAYAGSVEGVLKEYADDAFLIPSAFYVLHGKGSIRGWMTPDRVPLLSSPATISANVIGGTAFLAGTSEKSSRDTRSGGRLLILQRTKDGSWLITHNIWTGGSVGNLFLIGCFVLVPVCLGISLYAVIVYRERWRLLGAVPLVALAGYLAIIVIPAWLRDPALHMLPFELVIYLFPTVPYMIVLLVMRRIRSNPA